MADMQSVNNSATNTRKIICINENVLLPAKGEKNYSQHPKKRKKELSILPEINFRSEDGRTRPQWRWVSGVSSQVECLIASKTRSS